MPPFRPLNTTRTYFLAVMEELLRISQPERVTLADATVGAPAPGDPPPHSVQAAPRLTLMLEGSQKFAIAHHGQRSELRLRPGQAIFWERYGWALDFWDEPFLFFGIVFRPKYVRYIMFDHVGGPKPGLTPWSHHSRQPFSEAGNHLVWTLNALAGHEDHPATCALFAGLLHLAHQHLLADEPSSEDETGKASWSWLRVQEHLHENFAQPISRDSVARALHLHPNYLSALCRQTGGITFQQALETIRVERAQHLLQQREFTLEQIGLICGFSSATHFSRTFRRVTGTNPSQVRTKRQVPPAERRDPA